MNITKAVFGTALAAAVTYGGLAYAVDITGAGSTFAFPILAKWADAYKKETNNGLNYQSIGSGGGIKQIKAKTVTFGASDQPLKVADLQETGLVQWPQIMGAIVPVVNLDGIKPGDLVLDGKTLAADLSRQDHEMERPGDREIEPEGRAAQRRPSRSSIARTDRGRRSISPTISRRFRTTGRPTSAKAPPSSGRSVWDRRATRVSPPASPRRRARSAMSNMPTPSRTR